MIICSGCKKRKQLKSFSKDRSRKSGYRSLCRKCSSKHNKNYRINNRVKLLTYMRSWHRNNKGKSFGISIEQYKTLKELQNNKCAICKNNETVVCKGKLRELSIDHNHMTGKVRGLLCYACNVSLGLLKENTQTLKQMILYILKDKYE